MELSLAALDEILDSIPSGEPKYIWLTEETAQWIRGLGAHTRQAEVLGYEDIRTYRRDLSRLGAIHGRRLESRLGRWYRLTT
jgi:hypothetical protein